MILRQIIYLWLESTHCLGLYITGDARLLKLTQDNKPHQMAKPPSPPHIWSTNRQLSPQICDMINENTNKKLISMTNLSTLMLTTLDNKYFQCLPNNALELCALFTQSIDSEKA